MNYKETINYLFNQLPAFERQGNAGYKPGLQTTIDVDNLFGNPHRAYRCIHVAGTNGKGSVSNVIAAILQMQGHKVGLFTSPHFVDFRERIRVNGEMISQTDVVDFMNRFFATGYEGHPTFFELTTIMALDYFKRQEVDFAVIEVGLGGRLDSTNIISPLLSVITNISLDHTQFLGSTPAQVAAEKAGIIKAGVPVVIGEAQGEVRATFAEKAQREGAPICFATDAPEVERGVCIGGHTILHTRHLGLIINQLGGEFQIANSNTVLCAIAALQAAGLAIETRAISDGFERVCQITGLMGRWQQLSARPRTICDSGHNVGAFTHIVKQLAEERYSQLHIVLGFMKDKNIDDVLAMLPHNATYYFTAASTPRAIPAEQLQAMAASHGLVGQAFAHSKEALQSAKKAATNADLIYIGGSMYLLAEILPDYL